MGVEWIGEWIDKITSQNRVKHARDLKIQHEAGNPMLAAVIRVDLAASKDQIKFTFQRYDKFRRKMNWRDA